MNKDELNHLRDLAGIEHGWRITTKRKIEKILSPVRQAWHFATVLFVFGLIYILTVLGLEDRF